MMATVSSSATKGRSREVSPGVRSAVSKAAHESQVVLWDIERTTTAGRDILCVYVDVKGGIDAGALSDVTAAISKALDSVDASMGSYLLEVSSPGVTRTLSLPEHFDVCVGRTVRVHLTDDRGLEGVITQGGDDIRLSTKHGDESFQFNEVTRAKLVVDGI